MVVTVFTTRSLLTPCARVVDSAVKNLVKTGLNILVATASSSASTPSSPTSRVGREIESNVPLMSSAMALLALLSRTLGFEGHRLDFVALHEVSRLAQATHHQPFADICAIRGPTYSRIKLRIPGV